MKSLTNILRRSQLTPLERVTALVHNKVQKETTGKASLSDAEVRSIAELWSPRGNEEIRRFNKYIALMNLESTMKMEMQMYYAESDNILLRNHRMLDYMRYTYTSLEDFVTHDQAKEYLSESESLRFLLSHTYLEYDTVLHLLTFYNLDPATQKDLELLDEGIRFDADYFQNEVFLYELFDGDTELDDTRKKKLVSVLWDAMYSEKFRRRKNGSEKDGFLTHGAFVSIPVSHMIYACAEYLSLPVDYDNEKHMEILFQDFQDYAETKQSPLEIIIKPLLSQWIDDGLFISKYKALYLSNNKETWTGVTQEKHNKLFHIWYDELQKSKKYLDGLIDSQELECKIHQDKIRGGISVITGESLYTSKQNIEFINDFKEQIRYLIPIANIFLFTETYSYPLKRYATMKAFVELTHEFTEIFDIDLSQKYVEYCDEFRMQLVTVNMNLLTVLERFHDLLHETDEYRYYIGIDIHMFTFDIDQECEAEEMITKYKEEIKKNK